MSGLEGPSSDTIRSTIDDLQLSPSSDHGSGDLYVDWKERCILLEASLHKFKQRASHIRQQLSERLRDLEKKTQDSEQKAAQAIERNKLLEEQLQRNMPHGAAHLELKLDELEAQLQDKQEDLQELQIQLHEQKQLRMHDARMVSEKSAQIKAWVSQKLEDLESQNDRYRSDNDTLQQQVEELRLRLQMLPVDQARQIHRASEQYPDSPVDSEDVPPLVPERSPQSKAQRRPSQHSASSHQSSASHITSPNQNACYEHVTYINQSSPSHLSYNSQSSLNNMLNMDHSTLSHMTRHSQSKPSSHSSQSSLSTHSRQNSEAAQSDSPRILSPTRHHETLMSPQKITPVSPSHRAVTPVSSLHTTMTPISPSHHSDVLSHNSSLMLDLEHLDDDHMSHDCDCADEQDYQEIDDNHESKYEPCRPPNSPPFIPHYPAQQPPQIRIERRIFPRPSVNSSLSSTTVGSQEELLNQTRGRFSDEDSEFSRNSTFDYVAAEDLDLSKGEPSTGRADLDNTLDADWSLGPDGNSPRMRHSRGSEQRAGINLERFGIVMSSQESATDMIIPTMTFTAKSPPPMLKSRGPVTSHQGQGQEKQPVEHEDTSPEVLPAQRGDTYSALATLPRHRCKAGGKIEIGTLERGSGNRGLYPTQGTRDDTSTIPVEHARDDAARVRLSQPRPPTPPIRRLPSLEHRIYTMANNSLKIPEIGCCNRESSYPVTEHLYSETLYKDLTVPVYTTLKGKAAKIRNTPFTGASTSESSDDDISDMTYTQKMDFDTIKSYGKISTGIQTSSGAMKRGVSSQSMESDLSSDYAVPPDETIETDSSDTSEPELKLLKYTAESMKKDSLEKCGYLMKLSGKMKTWKRLWFVLKGGELLYYKGPNDIARKPQGFITLDSAMSVSRSENSHTLELSTDKHTYYLTADSIEELDHWIRVLNNVVKKQVSESVLKQNKAKETMKGWLIKTKHGRSRRCWCVLVGKFFMYYKHINDKTPLGQIHLRDARIEEVDRSCDSETDSDDTAIPDYTLGIWTTNSAPTYLMILTKHEKDSWLYQLTVSSGGGTGVLGTELEQIISRLMEIDGDMESDIWKHPRLLYQKEPTQEPLTTLPSETLQAKAVKLFKSCQTFMTTSVDSSSPDFHVNLAQSIIDTCLQHTELHDELYCQLITQTTRHPPQQKNAVQNLLCGGQSFFLCDSSPMSPTASVMDLTDCKQNPAPHVILQGWQLIAMCIAAFLPKQAILWYLKGHLQRHADPQTETGKLSVFCQRALERTQHNGCREARPSRMEILSILLRNPYHHSHPISIPVHFLDGTYQVVSFDGSTTVQEFLQTLNKSIGMRDCLLSGFALFTDDPAAQEIEHCLKAHIKLCDVISKWEQAYVHHSTLKKKQQAIKTIRLSYKNRLYFKSSVQAQTEREKSLMVYQLNQEIVQGRFPLMRDLALELAAIMAQIDYGDYRFPSMSPAGQITVPSSLQQLPQITEKFYPKRYQDYITHDQQRLQQQLGEKWLSFRGLSTQECVKIYLNVTSMWTFFGAKLFSARVRNTQISQVWLAVQEDSVSILEYATLRPIITYNYRSLVTFGGCREDLMLVVYSNNDKTLMMSTSPRKSKTHRLLFMMSIPKILEVTMLIASYVNTRNHRKHTQKSSSINTAMSGSKMSYMISKYTSSQPSAHTSQLGASSTLSRRTSPQPYTQPVPYVQPHLQSGTRTAPPQTVHVQSSMDVL